MRVAFIVNDLSGGGAEKALLHLASYLVERDHEVKLLTLHDHADAYPIDARIDRATLRTGQMARGPGRVSALPMQAAEAARWLRRWRSEVAVSFLARANLAHVMTRWFGNERPILLTEQVASRKVYPSGSVADRTMRYLIGRFYPRADGVFPSSQGVADGLKAFGVARNKMHVVYNTVNLRMIRKCAAESIALSSSSMFTIINIGRLVAQKDHATLLRAFAAARTEVPARLVILGQGPLQTELESLAERLGVRKDVLFVGWEDNPYAWLRRADLFVLSSIYEGFGNVVIEAMACGLPVVSTDCPSGPSEILREGKVGLLVSVGDAPALGAAIVRVLQEPGMRERLIACSRERARDFDINTIGPRYEALLQSYVRGVGPEPFERRSDAASAPSVAHPHLPRQ
jgi:glycosyltransferase involved in cell wall biosynthesis